MGLLSALFGGGSKTDIASLVSSGAVIIDVRTQAEYAGGHVSSSKNIPLDQLKSRMTELNKSTPVITCCASGMRSGSAKKILLAAGFENVVNGGSWTSLQGY